MGIRLPGELERLLNDLGYTWPMVDEDNLLKIGSAWNEIGGKISQHAAAADNHAQQIWTANKGQVIDAFRQAWEEQGSASENLKVAQQASAATGVGMMGAAMIVTALKMAVIVQLTILLVQIIQAIATAVPTFGLSLLEIPVFKKITGMIINAIISEALNALMGG
jgi:hypothetical protein